MNKRRDELLKASFAYISQNHESLSDKIPIHLIEFWIEEAGNPNIEGEIPSTSAVFMYALLRYHQSRGIDEFEITPNGLQDLKIAWTLTIQMVYMDRTTNVKIKPLRIFDFSIYDNLEYEFI